MKKEWKKHIWIAVLFFFSIIAVLYYIFAYTRGNMHSDTASILLLANQKHLKHQYFPDGFCYSTGVFIFGLENIVYLLMFFISDWVVCREITQAIMAVAIAIAILVFFRFVTNAKEEAYVGGMAGSVLFILPFSDVIYDLYFYQAAYANNVVLLMLTFSLIGKIMRSEKKTWIWFALLTVITVWNNIGIRNIMIVEFPLIVSLLICSFDFTSQKFRLSKKEKIIIGISGIGTTIGFFIQRIISSSVGWGKQTEAAAFVGIDEMMKNLGYLLKAVLEIYGVADETALFSLTGISLSFKMLYMILSFIIVPVTWLFLYQKIENKIWKLFIGYSWISNLCMTYLFVATTAGAGDPNHYLTVYVNNTILMGGFFVYLWKKNHFMIKRCLMASLIFYTLFIHAEYFKSSNVEMAEEDRKNNELVQYLRENDLKFGYATFWNAYRYMALTSGEIQIQAYAGQPDIPFYWLTSKDWYEPDYYNGNTFVLVETSEEIDDRYYGAAERIDKVGDYLVLRYPQNIWQYPKLTGVLLEEGETRQIEAEKLQYTGNAYQYGDNSSIFLNNGGVQYGPYYNLESGTYQICVEGKNLASAGVWVSLNSGEEKKEVDLLEQTEEKIVYQFALAAPASKVEFLTENRAEQTLEIEQMSITLISVP